MDDDEMPSELQHMFGRYRFPIEARKVFAAFVLVGIASVVYGVAVVHRPIWSHILITPITYLVLAALGWTVPMTVISESGIHRWWSTQKSHVQWSAVSDVIARPATRNSQHPVHALLTNGDDIVLIGVPPNAVTRLQRLASGVGPSRQPQPDD